MSLTAITGASVYYLEGTEVHGDIVSPVRGDLAIYTYAPAGGFVGQEYSYSGSAWFEREQIGASSKGSAATRIVSEDAIVVDAPIAFEQEIALSSAVALSAGSIPAGASVALIQAEGQNIRWRDDGVSPTGTVGFRLLAGESKVFGNLDALEFIEEAASAKLNVSYY